jgi:hypothetical protein
MADNQQITREIVLNLISNGADTTAKDINAIKTSIDKVIKTNSALKNDLSSLSKIIKTTTEGYVSGQKKAAQSTEKYSAKIGLLTTAFGKLQSVAMTTFQAFGSGSVGFKSIQYLEDYNKNLLQTTNVLSTLGISFKDFEETQKRIKTSLNLTMAESTRLFNLYSQGMPFASIVGFEKILKNLEETTGADAGQMEKFLGTIQGVIDKFPALQKSFEEWDESGKKNINNAIMFMATTGKANISEIRQLQQLVTEKNNVNKADAEKQKQVKQMTQDYKKFSETIMLGMGKALLPALDSIGKWVNTHGTELEDMFSSAANVITNKLVPMMEKIFALIDAHPTLSMLIGGAALLGNNGLMGGMASKIGGGLLQAGMQAGKQGMTTGLAGYTGGAAIGVGSVVATTAAVTDMIHYYSSGGKEKGAFSSTGEALGESGVGKAIASGFIAMSRWFKKDSKVDERYGKIKDKVEARNAANKDRYNKEALDKKATNEKASAAAAAEEAVKQQEQIAQIIATKAFESSKMAAATAKESFGSSVGQKLAQGTFTAGGVAKERDIAFAAEKQFTENAKKQLYQLSKNVQKYKDENKAIAGTVEYQQQLNEYQNAEAEMNKTINDQWQRRSEIANKIVEALDKQASLTAATSSKMETLVSLADNYAIGIGTSMQFRLKQSDAIQKQIDAEKASLAVVIKNIAAGIDVTENTKQKEEREAKIYGLMNQQLSRTKQQRDGWVSAIAAMNTGAGSFTKIMTSQTTGMGTMIKELGKNAIITNRGGSTQGGYRTSEKFGATGNITGAYSHSNTAYDTWGDQFAPRGVRNIESANRQNFGNFASEVEGKTNMARRGGFGAAAAGALPYGPSSVTESPPSANAGSNVNISTVKVAIDIKDINNLGKQIAAQLNPALTGIIQNVVTNLVA